MGLPPYIEEPLAGLNLPETLDRLKATSLFLGNVSSSKSMWKNYAYLRASFSEFRSVHQALYWDLGRDCQVHSPLKSSNPLVHLIFRLRRLAVYVASAPTSEGEVSVEFCELKATTRVDIKIILIDDLYNYLIREKLTDYHSEDIQQICEWFNKNQYIHGASHIFNVGVMQYCQELAEVYSDRYLTPAVNTLITPV